MVASSRTKHQPSIIYQVDSRNTAAGKIVASTKRRACWRYGHVNNQAVLGGNSGANCRGKEHEVTLVWSIASGKKRVFHNSKEVHFSVGSRTNGKFQCTWSSREHFFTIIAYAFPPSTRIRPRKQFELLINGYSFDNLPRIYELGEDSDQSSMENVNALMPKHTLPKHSLPKHGSTYNPLRLDDESRFFRGEDRQPSDEVRM
jgi:hypothetical protein